MRGQVVGLRGVDRERHAPLGDAGDLGRVDEHASVGRLDHDAVEDVLARVVLYAVHGAELDPVGRNDGDAAREGLVADLMSVVFRHAFDANDKANNPQSSVNHSASSSPEAL
jgi:hypothetical protein